VAGSPERISGVVSRFVDEVMENVGLCPRKSQMALVASLLLLGCGLRDRGLADRCADVLRDAWPGRVAVTSQQLSGSNDLATMTATAAGNVSWVSGGPHEVGIECTFQNNVLSGIRWTAGRGSGS